ncbi:steroid 17-alpha-hydroxylase/17,20 lyase-like [Acanthaster planci]|uniref:Steroid 17-alpha-hydroxylase/17,20 lyase-like n=1 Tax=Acanthaster planci TaxID=133434 RepID=A0A8B7Z3V7_ACAPL|nr:steroid 17-alpha-hydroxylase/17,20 lyase-like [Acanthaster planci]
MAVLELITENTGTVLLFVVTLVVLLLYQNARRPAGFPPGPPALPIIGNVLTFRSSEQIYKIFQRLAEQYGRIFSLKLGSFWVIVLNDVEDIREALIKQPIAFAGRPNLYTTSIVTDGFQDIAFSDYSPDWQLHRKIGHAALRHFASGEKLNKLVHSVLPGFAKVLDQSAGKPLDLKDVIDRSIYIVLANMCYGKSHDFDDPFLTKWFALNKRAQELVGGGLPRDYIHSLRYLPLSSREKRVKELSKESLDYIYDEFKGHRDSFKPDNIRDLFDSLIAAQQEDAAETGSNANFLTDTRVIQTVADLFGAGTGTTIPALYWAVAVMIEHPQILERVTKEIDTVIGPDRLPCLSDRSSMPYTEATLMEINRYGVVSPIGLPKSVTKDTVFRGFTIPKDTMVVLNVWAVHYDHKHWDEPNKFKPERFLDESGTKLVKPPASFMPFGVGRRSCIGENFARGEIFILFCWLVGRYSLSKVPGREDESLLTLDLKGPLNHEPRPFEIIVRKK